MLHKKPGMKLGIFSQMTAGYLAIFSLLIGSNVYAVLKLRQFNANTLHILNVDNRMLDYKKKLVDAHLSQVVYERKYFLTKDPVLYNRFLSAKSDFDKFLSEVSGLARDPAKKDFLIRTRTHNQRYESLVDTEAKFLEKNQPYSRKGYEKEKDKVSDRILEELQKFEEASYADVHARMEALNEAGAFAQGTATALSLVSIFLAVLTSFFITRSIKKPLTTLVRKTREISDGVFQDPLLISSPPEIAELTKAFNSMCDRLTAADKMKADFFSTISHELRTPLASIKEGTSLLLDGIGGSITEKQEEMLSILSEETNRLIGLVNSILDLSKMEAGMMTYHFGLGNVAPLIDRVMVEVQPLVKAKSIHVENTTAPDLPAARMDAERIAQVFRNLVSNAVKFTPEGGRITVSARSVDDGIEIRIADTGPGIPRERLTTIFEKFQSMDRTQGTGLGLTIVKHIITAHGGRVWAESRLLEGSTFIFVLPC